MSMQADVGLGPRRISRPAPARRHRTLDALASMDCESLESLFGSADAFPMVALLGHPRGRVLAMPGFDRGLAGSALRMVHAQWWWPWEGKSFAMRGGETEGRGTNRVLWPSRTGVFPFRTYQVSSVVDGEPCFAIDYDVPENPARVRRIYDEVRRVDTDLFLGRGMRRRKNGERALVLWFALDTSIQDVPVKIPSR
jgi:hypothetical protein